MKKFCGILAALVLGVGALTGVVTGVEPVSATSGAEIMAKACPSDSFLGFYPWYNGLECTDDDAVQAPQDNGDGQGLAGFIWTIILNIVADLTLAVGYIAIGVTIWGGFYMITSNGDPGKVTRARKILTAGVSGSLIAILASVIAHALISIL